MKRTLIAMTMVIALVTGLMGNAVASIDALLDPFTQEELDTNWTADRQPPSGGVDSVAFEGRDNVAAIGVRGEERSTQSSFYYFEGIKKVDDFDSVVRVDLYVPPEWKTAASSPANVGFWTSDDPITAYPLIVFRNGETIDAGFYVYDTQTGDYVDSEVDVEYGAWNTLGIALDPAADSVGYTVNGRHAGSSYAGSEKIGQVFLNHYNDGNLDYTAHWHTGLVSMPDADDCKEGGWKTSGEFKNQGQCIATFKANENAGK